MSQFTRNQTQNLVPFGLLPEEIQKEYKNDNRRLYEYLHTYINGEPIWKSVGCSPFPQHHQVYRLKILPDEWYYIEYGTIEDRDWETIKICV